MSEQPLAFIEWLAVMALLVGLVVVVAFAVTRVVRLAWRDRAPRDGDGIAILDERLARGEITFAEYDIARRALGR